MTLSEIGKKYGTDKVFHEYLDIYESKFEHLKCKKITFLEIGVFRGASIEMWREFFPNGTIYGIDTFEGLQGNKSTFSNPTSFLKKQQNNNIDRVVLNKVDQSSRQQLTDYLLSRDVMFDIVLDDASHLMLDQQLSIGVIFPFVKPRGFYVIEDICTSLDTRYLDVKNDFSNTTLTVIEKYLSDGIFQSQYLPESENRYIQNNIGSCELFWKNDHKSLESGTCIIQRLNHDN